MYKIIQNSFNFQDRSITRIRDGRGLEKSASKNSSLIAYAKHIKPEDGWSFFHVLFLGASEYYGPNRNGDGFTEAALIRRHDTFVQYGKVYRHHVNKDPLKSYGDIPYTTYCKKMKRVEGIIRLDNDKCQDVLDKYDSGEDIPVSMAAKLSFDVCEICKHESKTIDEYCDHLKNEMGNIYEDGRQVYADNPDPIFFDLSLVWRPADQTAYFFSKVASKNGSIYVPLENSSAYWGKQLIGIEKNADRADIEKMAVLEKHIDGVLAGEVNDDYIKALVEQIHVPEIPKDTLKEFGKCPFDSLLSTLTDHKVMLTPSEFFSAMGIPDDMTKEIKRILPSSFHRMMEDPSDTSIDFKLEDSPRLPLIKMLGRLLDRRRVDDNFFSKNLGESSHVINFDKRPQISISVHPGGVSISSSRSGGKILVKKSKNNVADKLANFYNMYKVSFCRRHPSRTSVLYGVVSNYAQ